MTKWLLVSLIMWLSIHAVLRGDTYNPVVKLGPFVGDLKFNRNMIATGHRLWGCEIVGQDLRDASFDNCDLFGVAFRQCDLRGATFRNAVLTGMIVDDCTWENNDFTNAVINGIVRQFDNDSTGVTKESLLTTWSFKNKDLSKCYIPSDGGTGFDFSQFDLSDAYVDNIKKALLLKCKLHRTVLKRCDLTECDFSGANMQNCSLLSCKLDYQRLKSNCLFLSSISINGGEFTELDLSGMTFGAPSLVAQNSEAVNLKNTDISGVTTNLLNARNLVTTKNHKIGNMVNITLIRCDLSGADFSRQVLVNTEFEECNLTGANFEDAVITNTTFWECTGLTREQIFSTWNSKACRMNGIVLPKE